MCKGNCKCEKYKSALKGLIFEYKALGDFKGMCLAVDMYIEEVLKNV